MRSRDDENLNGHPVELVVEDDDALVLVVDGGRLAPSDDVAKNAGGSGHRLVRDESVERVCD